MLRDRRSKNSILCSNCGARVPYGSFHCRGRDELNAYWTCTPMPEEGPPGPASVSPPQESAAYVLALASDRTAFGLIEALDKAGYVIVKKEEI